MCRLMHNKKRTAFWSEGFFSSLHTVVWLCLIKVYCSKILHCKISNLKTKLLPHVYQDVCAAVLFQHVQPHCLQSQGQVSSRSSASCQHQAHPRHLGLHSACLTPWHWLEGDRGLSGSPETWRAFDTSSPPHLPLQQLQTGGIQAWELHQPSDSNTCTVHSFLN